MRRSPDDTATEVSNQDHAAWERVTKAIRNTRRIPHFPHERPEWLTGGRTALGQASFLLGSARVALAATMREGTK